jgi:hypothetical protein
VTAIASAITQTMKKAMPTSPRTFSTTEVG